MFLKTAIFLIASLLAHTAMSAVMHRSSQNDAMTSASLQVRSNATLLSDSIEASSLESQRGRGGAGDVIDAVSDIINAIQDGIRRDNEARSRFTKDLVGRMYKRHPNFNWIICHTEHIHNFNGTKGIQWDHRHQEFDIKVGGTIGYEIYNFGDGEFTRKGDGGYLNWAYIGRVVKIDQGGRHLVFKKP